MSLTIDLGPYLDDGPVRLRVPKMSATEFWEFCRRNRDLSVERTSDGEIIIMSPTGGETGNRNLALARYLDEWVERDGSGYGFDSSTLFRLPNGAERSPDAAWIRADRWEALALKERDEPAPVCPDFVVELMSPSDRLADTQRKMREYIANGARLGWLIQRKKRQVHVYRPGQPVQILNNPAEVAGDPELPGFVLKMKRIF